MAPRKTEKPAVDFRNLLNRTDYSEPAYGGDPEPQKARRFIPHALRRQWARQSTEGGTARCHYCGQTFAVYYCKLTRIDWRTVEHVCADCRKARNLHLEK